jgi:class 3 adenylate cyclase
MAINFGRSELSRLQHLTAFNWRLRFSAEQEKLFREEHYRKTIVIVRSAIGLGLVLNLLFIFLDTQTFFASKQFIELIRFVIVTPVVSLTMLVLCLPALKALVQPMMTASILTTGVFVLSVIAFTEPAEPSYLYQITLLLVIITTYTILQLRFGWATLVNWLITAGYIGVAIFYQHLLASPMGMTLFFSNLFFLFITHVVGMFASYSLEFYLRRDFVQRQIIELEQAKAERLLLNVLPREIATALKDNPRTIAEHYDNVSILFADVVNFTPLSARLEPKALVELLNEMFSHFDTLVDKYGLEKIKTIGDCYMVAAGVPVPRPDHAQALAGLALEMQEYVNSRTFLGAQLALRIGLNSGPVVAGIIGHKKFSYDLWGDTVNTASRMESHGSKGKIQLTTATYELLKDEFECEPGGMISVKGKGTVEIWYLSGKKPSPSFSHSGEYFRPGGYEALILELENQAVS